MTGWAEYFASFGFIAMAIGPNDEMNATHHMRAEGLQDAIETVIDTLFHLQIEQHLNFQVV